MTNKLHTILFSSILSAGLLAVGSTVATAQDFDPNMPWPLCGRIAEAPPPGWQESDGCPSDRWGDPAHADVPISSTFGPRPLVSGNYRYDFHRGLDIAAPIGTPVFAIADGVVRTAGNHSSYSDPVIIVRHFRPGHTSCSNVGCYHANYQHMSGWVVDKDDVVVKGQLLGYTGESASGFDHLHFEIRNAPADDPFSSWQRDTIHPLNVLPYNDPSPVTVTIDAVDETDPARPIVEVTVTTPRADVNRVEVTLYDAQGAIVDQAGNTADGLGYNILPSFFDMDMWNVQYTHKDSSGVPWESYDQGGANECPYHADHPSGYTAHVHMDQQDPSDYQAGLFNGVRIETSLYSQGDYWLNLTFLELTGPAACIEATATMTNSEIVTESWGDCGGYEPNNEPVADDQAVSTDEDWAVGIILTGSDPDGDPISYTVVQQPAHGVLTGLAPDLTYTPDPDYHGADSFEFVTHDGDVDSVNGVVSITVDPVNDAPVADSQSVQTNKNTALAITLTASDVDNGSLSYAVTALPQHGILSGTAPDLTYTPDTDYSGSDSFTFEADDGNGGTDSATVSINVKKGKGGGGDTGGGGNGGGKGKKK